MNHSAPSTPILRPSFWNRWTRLSSASSSGRTEVDKQASEQAFHTPSRKSTRPTHKLNLSDEHSEADDEELLPLTPPDASLCRPRPGSGSKPATAAFYSRLRAARPSSLLTTSTAPTRSSLDSIRIRADEATEDDNGHAAVLAGFLKNTGGYMDDSESEDDECPAPPVLHPLPLSQPRYVFKHSAPMIDAHWHSRTRSVHSPVRSAGPILPMLVSTPTRPTKVVPALQPPKNLEPSRAEVVAKRRPEGQPLFRSLVLCEDDMLRLSI
ncbi:hypothetical protein CROQUDRAFT_50320 [Cronartium quercuum f. sp. fusiforme G11]|uniref:Uncharacterized protein n=1 Tax=Cronartium quercuum f. sp. fusiforme G11 TaxID=708437 RepID=A0A9P6T7X8_9BASI|nr:hypothetical protein CROQUDRAFT_50320 [Cronartium quercuum f. sp. fusiforme G11]